MCCCSVGIIIMKHALSLFHHNPSLSFPPIAFFYPFYPVWIHFWIPYHSFSVCYNLSCSCLDPRYPFLSNHSFSTSPLPCSLPSRGAGVIGALSVLSQRATGSGQGTLHTGFCPGGCSPLCPSLWPSPCTHPAPAPPGSAGPRNTKVHKLNTPLSSLSALPL